METIMEALLAIDFNWDLFLKSAAVLAVGSVLLGAVGRFAFGKKSILSCAVSSAIGILFMYAVTVVLYSAGAKFSAFIAPLPFVTFSGSQMELFSFTGADYTIICTQVLSTIVLAFLANLIDTVMPKGKNFFVWFLLRCITVVFALALHLLVTWLFTTYLPEGLVTYAPTILLGLLVLLLLVGALKLVVGAVLATVNPLIGAFYTFFFATIVGKALTKAMVTAAILSAIILALNYIGLTAVSIATAALIAYIPLLIVMLIIWYIVNKLF